MARPVLRPSLLRNPNAESRFYGRGGSLRHSRRKGEGLDSAIRRMLDHRGAYLLDVQIDPDCMVFPMTPAGSCVTHIMLNATEKY